ncbi:MAG: molybdopterin biosynthesis protein [Firmicutes bacterium]|nr:molybdopterin biosynthesis protein [Bacillota bacterium]
MSQRNIYLESLPWEEALQRFLDRLRMLPVQPGVETTATRLGLGRILARPVFATSSWPHYHAAAMDGIAVRAEDTFQASDTNPLDLQLGKEAVYVDTGDPLPEDYDAVIMLEDLNDLGNGTIQITAAASPWQHVRLVGADVVQSEMILPAGHRLRPFDLGALLAAGILEVPVRPRPRVAIIPSGNEIVVPGEGLRPGDIPEFNSAIISGLITGWGGEPLILPIARDNKEDVWRSLEEGLARADMVVINAGSSAGSEDFTSTVIGELGEVLVHGAAIKPGKPIILGVAQGKPVFGIPGYPVSVYVTCQLFLRPVLALWQGVAPEEPPRLKAYLSRRVTSPLGEEEFIRVKLGQVGQRVVATPLPRGAGVIMSLVRADGIFRVPRLSEGVAEGQEVTVELFRRPEEIARTLVAIGSHDVSLDLLANSLAERFPGYYLSSAHVGSLGGILAVRRGEAHLAGVHLLDEESGQYNVPYVQRFLPGKKAVLVTLMHRDQGLIVKKGNPKGIGSFRDLSRPDVLFVNRQRGAGTRILLDYELKRAAIDPDQVRGYGHEEFTHMAVAVAVASGTADVGLGILAAARALDLDFVPVTQERYDLLIPAEHYDTLLVKQLLFIVRDAGFQRAVLDLGGYDMRETGRETWLGDH